MRQLLDAGGVRTADEKEVNSNETGDISAIKLRLAARIDVRFEKESVWLTLDQPALLFGRDKSTVSRHLKNIFVEEELKRDSVAAKIAPTAADGKIYLVDYYNLVAVIFVSV